MGEFSEGDRVKVTFEANVAWVGKGTWVDVSTDDGLKITVPVVHAEKIEPPVEVFKVGDRVRRKVSDNWHEAYEITLAHGGYLQHLTNGQVTWRDREIPFTSANFELVYRTEVDDE